MRSDKGSLVTGTADLSVAVNEPPPPRDLVALTIIPSSGTQTLNALSETAQFIAIGTFNTGPVTADMTDLVTWQSSDVNIATINSSGLATAVGCVVAPTPCTTTITASFSPPSGGAFVTGTSNLNVHPGSGGSSLPSLTVYKVGQGNGTVTSNPPGINCGSGSGCTGNFVLNSPVTLTATPASSSSFLGWSANCKPSDQPTCTVDMSNDQTVGAIFNQ